MKIELNERELEIILDALDCWRDKIGSGGNATDEIVDLAADLFESLHRDDGFGNDAVPDAAAEFIQAGIDAREQVKASSRAAGRRDESLSRAVTNDPIDW